MTNKQLFKILSSQQNRFINVYGYSFHLSYYNQTKDTEFYSISIHDKYEGIIYKDYFGINDTSLNIKLNKLKDFIDDLFNKEKTRN